MLNIRSVRLEGGDPLAGNEIHTSPSDDGLEDLQQRCRIVGYSASGATNFAVVFVLTESVGGERKLAFDVSGQTGGRGANTQFYIPGTGILFNTGVKLHEEHINGGTPSGATQFVSGVTLFYQT